MEPLHPLLFGVASLKTHVGLIHAASRRAEIFDNAGLEKYANLNR
jgi:hypothetical protein